MPIITLYDCMDEVWIARPQPLEEGDPIGKGATETDALQDFTRQVMELCEQFFAEMETEVTSK
jgi:hypothetical protein